MPRDQGLLYFAKGKAFVAEAERSARQAAKVMPEYPIAIVADREPNLDCFDTIIIDKTPFEKRDKPRALQKTPYDQTIYLDTDTYLSDSIDDLFDILGEFDLALRRDRDQSHVPEDSSLPGSFPEFHAGVISYQSTESVMNMLDDWERRCLPTHDYDQRSLRPALYHSDVRFTPIPNRYNCQYHWDNIVDGSVKVFHGPLVEREVKSIDPKDIINLQDAISKLSESDKVRLHYRRDGTLYVDPPQPFLARVYSMIRHHRLQGLLAKAAKKLMRGLWTLMVHDHGT
jgi:hypothetical protein